MFLGGYYSKNGYFFLGKITSNNKFNEKKPLLNILNFIHELVFLENRINLEPKDLKICIKNISDAHLVVTNKIAGENRAKACVKEAISDDYFKNKF